MSKVKRSSIIWESSEVKQLVVAFISQMVERPMERWAYVISAIIHSSLIFVGAKSCMKIDLSIMSYKCSVRLMLGEWVGSTIFLKVYGILLKSILDNLAHWPVGIAHIVGVYRCYEWVQMVMKQYNVVVTGQWYVSADQ